MEYNIADYICFKTSECITVQHFAVFPIIVLLMDGNEQTG